MVLKEVITILERLLMHKTIGFIDFCDEKSFHAGNFNVAEHIQTEENNAVKTTSHVLMSLAFIMMI